jgi:O-antigen/teichoic acid export membrane protein
MTPLPLSVGALRHGLARVATLALGLALLVAVARRGPEVQGAFSLFVAVESLLLTLGSGLGLVLAREVSHAGAPPAPLLRGLLRLASTLGLALAAGLLAWALASPAPPYAQLWLLALAAPLLLWAPTAGGLWLGQGRMWALNAPALAAPALVLLGLGLVPAGAGGASTLLAVLAAWTLAKTLVGAASGLAALRQAGAAQAAPWPPPIARAAPAAPAAPATSASSIAAAATVAAGPVPTLADLWRRHGRFIAMVGLANVVALLNLRATLFIVERLHGLAAAGVYAVAVQVAELLWLLSSAFTVAAYHRIGGTDRAAAARLTLAVVRIGLALALGAAPLLGLLGWWALPALLGPAYADARVPLLVVLPGVALYAAASGLSAFHTNLEGRPQWAARVAGLSLVLTLALAWPAVPTLGPAGAALATSVGYGVAIGVALHGFLRDQGWGWRALWRGVPAPQSRP